MTKYPILITTILLPFMAISQLKIQTSLQGGYEYNIFKNPDSLNNIEAVGLEQSDLLQSASLAALVLNIDWKKKWKKHQFILGSDLDGQLFPSSSSANLSQLDLNQGYAFQYSKKIKFHQKATYRNKNRQGIDAASEFFFLPNSYQQSTILGGMEWKATKRAKVKFELGKLFKDYQATETSALTYNETNAKIYTRYKFKKKSALQQIELTGRWRNRLYTRERFDATSMIIFDEETEDFEDTFDSTFEEYDMRYLVGSLAFKFQIKKYFSLKPAIEYTKRNSTENIRLQYNQIRPILGLDYEKGSTKIKWTTSYAFRNNPNLFPTSNSEDFLVYQYWRNTIIVEHQLNKKLSIQANINHIMRLSNFDEPTKRSYRPYDYARVLVGVRYEFGK